MQDEVIVKGFIFLECSDNALAERSLNRPKTEERDEDTAETIKLKIETFHKETMPVIDIFKKR
jgi:adenylate kinase family enzyme